MKLKDFAIRGMRRGYRFVRPKKFTNDHSELNRQLANDYIYELLINDKPCMISRLGTTELICVNNFLTVHSKKPYLHKIFNYIVDNTQTPWWNVDHFKYMDLYSGIFPANKVIAERFSLRYLDDIPLIDILGSFQYYERFMPLRRDTKFVHLETLYPFFVERPWTRALKGKKVLVVHPFESTIKQQFKKNNLLFETDEILPDFELKTLRAVQSVGGTKVQFKDWFEALNYLKNQISDIDFDICLLGCGAYGLPLAAHVKRMGKKAIHIGGGLQLLFGIKGKRWDSVHYGKEYNIPSLFINPYCTLYNDYWIKPLLEDTPENAIKVDNACYW